MKRGTSLAFAIVLFASAAGAQTDKARAKDAYDRGTQAHARGDFARAAQEFARADALAPSPVALQAALDAAVEADDPVLGAELLERSKRAKPSGALMSTIEVATKKLGGRAGRVQVTCPSGARCTSSLDGASFDPARGQWARVGPHTLVIDVNGARDTRTVEVRAGEAMEVVPAVTAAAPRAPLPSPAAAPASPPPSRGPSTTSDGEAAPTPHAKPLPPVVFFVGAGLTVALAGVATFYGLRARRHHRDFVDAGCGVTATSPCQDLKDDGERLQTIANIGFGATAVAGVATVLVGTLFTDWGQAAKTGRAPVVVPVAGGFAASYGARF